MKFYFKMPIELRPYYQLELSKYKSSLGNSDLPKAWHHLERAHILGQAYPIEHSLAHWKMLQFGFKIKSWKRMMLFCYILMMKILSPLSTPHPHSLIE